MRKALLLMLSVAALVAAAPASAKTVTVAITKAGYVPNSLTIPVGDTVTWTNSDTVNHQVASQTAPFASPILKPTESYSYTFAAAGKYQVTDPLVKNLKMTVTVTGTPPPANGTVTLAASRTVLVYGGKVTLSGTLSTQQAGQTVDILAQQCGASAATKLTTVTTTTGGAYTYLAQPLKNTTYTVKVKNSTSPAVTVNVRPLIRLGKIAPRRFSVRVSAAESFAGKYVSFQRFNAATSRWVVVRSAVLRPGTGAVDPTVISSVTLTAKVKARTRVRVVMSQTAVGTCYKPWRSNVIYA